MRRRGSVGSDSRVSGADWVSMAAILPGPVQAWPRPGPAPTPPPAATARAAPQPLVQVCYVTAWTAPPMGRAYGRLPARFRPRPSGTALVRSDPLQLRAGFRHAPQAYNPALFPPILIPKLAQPVTLSVFVPRRSAWLCLAPYAKFYTRYPRSQTPNHIPNPLRPWSPDSSFASLRFPLQPPSSCLFHLQIGEMMVEGIILTPSLSDRLYRNWILRSAALDLVFTVIFQPIRAMQSI